MLWGAVTIFVRTWCIKYSTSRLPWVFILIPLYPTFVCLSSVIWKDVHFAFAYLFAASFIVQHILLQTSHTKIVGIIMVPIFIFYGTACKFQAIYIMPFFVSWYVLTFFDYKAFLKIALIISFSFLIGVGIMIINGLIARDVSHSNRLGWQEVKFNDLLCMSINMDKPLFPSYILNNKTFDFNFYKDNYNPSYAMTLLYQLRDKQPVRFTQDINEQKAIMQSWQDAITTYPATYIKCRLKFMGRLLANTTWFYLGIPENYEMDKYYHAFFFDTWLTKCFVIYAKHFVWMSRGQYYAPFMFLYCYGAFVTLRKDMQNKEAQILFFLNLLPLLFILVMIFTAVNLDMRYLFVCHALFHFSHPFAYIIFLRSGVFSYINGLLGLLGLLKKRVDRIN
jgi:hypothetical protein